MRTGTKVRLTVICVCVVAGMVGCAVMLFGQGTATTVSTKPYPTTIEIPGFQESINKAFPPKSSTPKEYKLTEIQQLRLSNTQKDAIILKAQLQDVQRQFQEKVSELMSTANKIKLENGWPPETQFNPDNLQFSAPPAVKEGEKK